VTGNVGRAEDYINYLGDGETYFLRPSGVPRVITERACIHCGKPYTISIPYDKCVPGLRDLCDTCIVKGVKLP
jgi:hypothetical protein